MWNRKSPSFALTLAHFPPFLIFRQASATVLMVYEFAYHVFFWQAIYAVAFRQIKWVVRVCIKELKFR